MALFQRNQFSFKDTTVDASVPDNDVARLMYYFHCVCSAIEYNDTDVSRYRNYQYYASLSYNEIRILLVLCLTLSPDEFDNRVFFHSDAMCKGDGNRFYEVSQVTHQFMAVQSIVIAGRRCQVNKIMTYTMSWMRNNYYGPIQRLTPQFSARALQTGACVIS